MQNCIPKNVKWSFGKSLMTKNTTKTDSVFLNHDSKLITYYNEKHQLLCYYTNTPIILIPAKPCGSPA